MELPEVYPLLSKKKQKSVSVPTHNDQSERVEDVGTKLDDLSNILVTGGCGFIGSHLVRRLVENRYNVSVIDNLRRGDLSTINDLIERNAVSFIKGDITVPQIAEQATKDIDAVFHLAALIDAYESAENPISYFFTNALGTVNMLQACVKNGVHRFVFASTAAVYGNSKKLPIKEDNSTIPTNPYGKSKLIAEDSVKMFDKASGMRTTILRLFNVYGSNGHSAYSGVINKFIERISGGLGPIIYGDGEQTRDFVHISDVVDAFLLALKSSDAAGETFNIASGSPISINELYELVIELTGKDEISPIYEKARDGDIRHSYADIRKAKLKLNYRPKVDLEQG